MPIREKNVTVSFFQLHTFSDDGSHVRESAKGDKSTNSLPVADTDWQARLKEISKGEDAATTRSPKVIKRNEKIVDGQVREADGKFAISLSVDRAIPPRERNLQTGERKGMAGSGKGWEPAEETVVTLYERNIFGLLSSNIGAPTHTDMARWLTEYSPPYSDSNARWIAKPITRPEILEQLINKKGLKINSAEFTIRPNQMDEEDLGIFGLMPQKLNQNQGMEIAIAFRAGRTKNKGSNAREIAGFVDDIVKAPMFRDEDKVKRAKVGAKPDEGETQFYDLFSDRITHRTKIKWDDRQNRSDFMKSAVTTIDYVYSDLKPVLHDLVPKIEPQSRQK